MGRLLRKGFFVSCPHVKSLQLCLTLCNPLIIAHQAPLSMGFSRQENWCGLPCPPLWILPDPGTEPTSLMSFHWQAGYYH